MFNTLWEHWENVKRAKPGTRFQNRYARREGRRCTAFVKPFYLMLGAVLFLAGLLLMPAPGPGILVVLVGAGMLAEESLVAAKALDWLELKVRALLNRAWRGWKRTSAAVKALIAAVAASTAAGAAWAAYAVLVD